jgi:hypothetical protein
MRRLTALGFAITAIWLMAFALILVFNLEEARKLDLNEWGDFFSGATAPLALIWVVIGYFLQAEELRVNTAALKAQEEELRRQVQETAVLAKNSERQAIASEQLAVASKQERDRAAMKELADVQPIFRTVGGAKTGSTYTTNLRNVGATVTKIAVTTPNAGVRVRIWPTEVFEQNSDGQLIVEADAEVPPIAISLSYVDRLGNEMTRTYDMTGAGQLFETREYP